MRHIEDSHQAAAMLDLTQCGVSCRTRPLANVIGQDNQWRFTTLTFSLPTWPLLNEKLLVPITTYGVLHSTCFTFNTRPRRPMEIHNVRMCSRNHKQILVGHQRVIAMGEQ